MPEFRCSECRKAYNIATMNFQCENGGVFKLVDKDAEFPVKKSRKPAMWRYYEAISIENK